MFRHKIETLTKDDAIHIHPDAIDEHIDMDEMYLLHVLEAEDPDICELTTLYVWEDVFSQIHSAWASLNHCDNSIVDVIKKFFNFE